MREPMDPLPPKTTIWSFDIVNVLSKTGEIIVTVIVSYSIILFICQFRRVL